MHRTNTDILYYQLQIFEKSEFFLVKLNEKLITGAQNKIYTQLIDVWACGRPREFGNL